MHFICISKFPNDLKEAVVIPVVIPALLTDLPKAFDCFPHKLIIVKQAGYGFDTNVLKLIHSCLSNRKQRMKVNSAYNIWKVIFYVPQGSILGPLLFNIHLSDLFYFLEKSVLQVMKIITLSIQLRKT